MKEFVTLNLKTNFTFVLLTMNSNLKGKSKKTVEVVFR